MMKCTMALSLSAFRPISFTSASPTEKFEEIGSKVRAVWDCD